MKYEDWEQQQTWLTLADLAARWKVCKRTVTRIPAGRLPYYNLPTQRRYRLQDVERYERLMQAMTPHNGATEKKD